MSLNPISLYLRPVGIDLKLLGGRKPLGSAAAGRDCRKPSLNPTGGNRAHSCAGMEALPGLELWVS